jgi:hypothetical protein
MSIPDAIPDLLLERARAGDEAALGSLLELYHNFLRLVARALIGQSLRVRLDASDLVRPSSGPPGSSASSSARPSPS